MGQGTHHHISHLFDVGCLLGDHFRWGNFGMNSIHLFRRAVIDVNIDVDDGESSNEDKDGGGLEIPTNVSSTSDVVSQATSRNGGEEEAISSSSEVETLFEIEPQIGTCGYPNQRSSGGVIIPFNHHNIHAFRLAQQLVGVTALALYIGLW